MIKPVHPKGNQPWIHTGRTDAEAETPIYFGHLMQGTDSLEKTLMLGKIEGGKRRGWQRMREASPTQWKWVWVDSRSWWWTERPGMLWSMGSQRVGHDWATELYWTEWYTCEYINLGKYMFFKARCLVFQKVSCTVFPGTANLQLGVPPYFTPIYCTTTQLLHVSTISLNIFLYQLLATKYHFHHII